MKPPGEAACSFRHRWRPVASSSFRGSENTQRGGRPQTLKPPVHACPRHGLHAATGTDSCIPRGCQSSVPEQRRLQLPGSFCAKPVVPREDGLGEPRAWDARVS